MIINCKCLYLGKREGNGHNGPFKIVQFMEKQSKENLNVFVEDFGRFASAKDFQEFDLTFNLYKNKNGQLVYSLVGA